ncbi:hypothetical protein FSP39_012530 [Pinctada imbricata]|uniref:Hexosyltransferase n=1 Tax=Pinctada imbricata TaxID=66713 RepID=A0AA88YIC1_PINIB|nr:hypothetical protein FSP39_012530 [Pinctada imbricata]
MVNLGECLHQRRLAQAEKILMYVIIWACFIFLHLSFQRTKVIIKDDTEELERFVAEKENIDDDGTDDVFKLSAEDQEVVRRKEEDELARIKERDAKELVRLKEERARWFKPVSKYKEADVMKWLGQRPASKGRYNETKVHPNLPKYLIQERDICSINSVDFLLYFNSHPANFERRNYLRKTWAGNLIFKNLVVRTIFVLGNTESAEQKKKVEEESKMYHDIIQGNINDTYRNISLKVLLMLDWVHHYCPHAKYVIKADDDFYVNPYLMIENMISEIWKKPRVVMCHTKTNNPVISEKNSKWYISEDMLPKEHKKKLPQFCAGYVVLFTGNLIPDLRKVALDTPIIPVDDVYLFGFLMKGVKDVEFISAINHYTLSVDTGEKMYRNYEKEIKLVAVSAWQEGTMEHLWDKTLDRLTPLGKELVNPNFIPSES